MRIRIFGVLFGAASFFLALNAGATTWTYSRIPHLAVGGGYTSYLTISDAQGTATRQFSFYLYRDDGSPLYVSVNGSEQVASYSFTLPPLGESTLALTSNLNLVGWISIAGEGIGNYNASLRFNYADSRGNIIDAVGILPSEPNRSWTLPVDKENPTEYVGVAIANPWNRKINLTIDLYQDGVPVPGATSHLLTLQPLGHWAGFVHQLFPGASSFSGAGTLKVYSASDSFCAVALRADGQQYSSLPASPETQLWSWSYADAKGITQSGTWSWRFHDGASFIGYELSAGSPDTPIRLRGLFDSSQSYFMAERYYNDSNLNQATIIFQGTPGKSGTTDIITGTRVMVNKDGSTSGSFGFTATRLY